MGETGRRPEPEGDGHRLFRQPRRPHPDIRYPPREIFVVRNVAALVPPFETTPGRHGVSAALEFAVQFLKIEEILVMGHGYCGAAMPR